MKNVLVLIHTPTFGGPHNQMIRLKEPLAVYGWELIVVLPEEEGDGYDRLKSAGIQVIRTNISRIRALKPWRNIFYFRNLRKEVKNLEEIVLKYNIDLIQVCGLMHIHGAILSRRLKKPLVWQLLSTFAPKILRAIYTPIVGKFAHVVMSTGMMIVDKHPFNEQVKSKLIPFYPPVNTADFTYTAEKRKLARRYLSIPEDGFLISTVGNQNRQKSHEQFVKVAAMFKNTESIYFRICGQSTDSQREIYTKSVLNLAKKYDLYCNDFFDVLEPGKITVDQILSATDVFLLTSFAEGVPTAILEAMSVGLPIISTKVGSIPEIVKDQRNGFLYDFDDLSSVKSAIEELYMDPEKRRMFSISNRQDAIELFDTSKCVERHVEAYRLAMSKNNG